MAEARAAVADYALKISAMVDVEIPGSAALAAALLAPVDDLRAGRRTPAKVDASTESATVASAPADPSAPAVTPRRTGTG